MIADTLEDISDSTGIGMTKVMQLAINDYNFRVEHKINHGGDVMVIQFLLRERLARAKAEESGRAGVRSPNPS